MVRQYRQQVPVLYGSGAIAQLGEKLKELGCKKVMCVYDGGVKAAGVGEKAEASLKAAGIDYVVFDEVAANAPSKLLDRAGEIARREKVDGVVGVGGGSSMDSAKSIALLLDHPSPITQYITGPPTLLKSSVPIILIPTTSGTGSEVTQVSNIYEEDKNEKNAVFVYSTLAILDPELTKTVPPAVTAFTGMDALSHAVEAITASKWNPHSELLASTAISKIVKYLPRAVKDGNDMEARENLSLASNWAGIAFADTDVHFGHALADALSAAFHTPHGVNCALATPATIHLVAPAVPDKVRVVGEAMGLTIPAGASPAEIAAQVEDALHALMREVGISSVKEMGHTKEELLAFYNTAWISGLKFNSPVEITEELTKELLAYICDTYQ